MEYIIIIGILVLGISLYAHFKPNIDIVINSYTISLILWYNIRIDEEIRRDYKVLFKVNRQ